MLLHGAIFLAICNATPADESITRQDADYISVTRLQLLIITKFLLVISVLQKAEVMRIKVMITQEELS